MEALRVGGLVSGLDTNGIIDSLMTKAKEPIKRLNNQVDLLTFEKKSYNDIISAMSDMKSSLLSLKMESTFKSKIVGSSKEEVAAAVAGTSTPPGTYTVKVDRTAQGSYATSSYTSYAFMKTGAGVQGFTSLAKSKYDQLQGLHNVTISNPTSGKWVATDVFTPKNGEKYDKMAGASADASLVDVNGKITSDINNQTVAFLYTFNGESRSARVTLNYPAGTYLTSIASDLEKQINDQIDASSGKDGSQRVAIRTDMDETTGKFNFDFYDVTDDSIEIVGFIDPVHLNESSPVYNTATDTLAKNLGIFTLRAPVKTDEMRNVLVSNTAANLSIKINHADGGLFPGNALKFEGGSVQEGTFTVNQDSTANNKISRKSLFTGAEFSAFNPAAPATKPTDDEIEAWLNSSLSATDQDTTVNGATVPYTRNYFDTKPSTATNGFFHINGVRIEIDDYTAMSPSILMAKINGSGAGVTAYFDYEAGVFKIESNTPGTGDITLGQDGDTSDILSVLKVSISAGSLYVRGTSEGTLDTSKKIAEGSGITVPVNSGIFTINGVAIYVDTVNDTIEDVMDKVNKSGAGVTMSYDQATDKFNLRGTGTDKIKIGGPKDTSNFLEAAGLTYSFAETLEVGSAGSKAVFTVNGTKYVRDKNEVKDVVEGMTINLSGEGTTVITVGVDSDKAVEAMAEFASEYNKLVNLLSPTEPTKDDRKKYADPLTDEDKKDMSEDDIKDYESNYERIKYYDLVSKSSELRYLKTNLRTNLMKEVTLSSNPYNSLSALGIEIAGTKPAVNIKITSLGFLIDVSTDKDEIAEYIKNNTDFASIVKNNSDEVYDFFTQSKTVNISKATGKVLTDKKPNEPYYTVEYEGWARRYDDFILNNTSATSAIYKKAGTNGTIDSQINRLKEQIEIQTTRAENYLERMWAQFSAMEARLQNIQAQGSYLSQIAGNSSS